MGIFDTKKLAPTIGANQLKDWEISFISKCFECYGQEGDFEVRLDESLCLYVKFYSRKMMSDILLVPDFIKIVSKDGAMVITSKKALGRIGNHNGYNYRKILEDYRWS